MAHEDESNQQANEYVIPPKSKRRYNQIYNRLRKWKASKDTTSNSEAILMAFFEDYGKNKQPPSLYAAYSMLKATIKINDNVDIGTYHKLSTYLKAKLVGYKPNKAKVFTEVQIEKFIREAPDEAWLDVKVATFPMKLIKKNFTMKMFVGRLYIWCMRSVSNVRITEY